MIELILFSLIGGVLVLAGFAGDERKATKDAAWARFEAYKAIERKF